MKKTATIAMVVLMMATLSGSALAANSLSQGSKGISVGMGDSVFSHAAVPGGTDVTNPVVNITGRYFVSKDVAIYGGFGLQMNSSDYEGTYFSFTVGARKYLSTNDFSPFVGGQFSYVSENMKDQVGTKIADMSVFDFAGLFGAEYFFSKNFSVEGAIGIGVGQVANDLPGRGDTTYIGTRTVGVHANFYF
jgi:hypothetical protein